MVQCCAPPSDAAAWKSPPTNELQMWATRFYARKVGLQHQRWTRMAGEVTVKRGLTCQNWYLWWFDIKTLKSFPNPDVLLTSLSSTKLPNALHIKTLLSNGNDSRCETGLGMSRFLILKDSNQKCKMRDHNPWYCFPITLFGHIYIFYVSWPSGTFKPFFQASYLTLHVLTEAGSSAVTCGIWLFHCLAAESPVWMGERFEEGLVSMSGSIWHGSCCSSVRRPAWTETTWNERNARKKERKKGFRWRRHHSISKRQVLLEKNTKETHIV